MLDLLGEKCFGDNSLEALQKLLVTYIHSVRILLVLDDVWEDEKKGDWEQLIVSLSWAKQGSQILFTTRQKSIPDLLASVIRAEHESLALRDLEEQELRLIFDCYAFYPCNPDEYGDLQAIGDQIVKKLHGSPLAAKVIGSLLSSNLNVGFWRRISDHDSLINLEEANDIMKVLELSYYNLPADLQVCFRFCSIFPEDHGFDKEELIKMWMASGFLRQEQNKEQKKPEEIGEDYFNIFLRKSFFEVSKAEEGHYVMHDLIHKLATNVSEGECCRIGCDDKSLYISSTVRHVSVYESEIQKISHLQNIRSLVITTCEQQDKADPKPFVLPKNLVTKSLCLLKINANRCCKLQDEVSYLVHLRYLSISQQRTWEKLIHCILYAPICNLYHLLVLEIVDSVEESVETIGMTKLVNLRYMRLPDCIMKTIFGIHKMTSLLELTFFVGQNSGYRVNELCTLNNLRHLTIFNIGNIRDPAEARSANLLAMQNLQSLKLICTSDETNLGNHEQILHNLQPHKNLMELEIMNYDGQGYPMWMMGEMPHLSTFTLLHCKNVNNQSSFGQMPHLKIIQICNCPNIEILPDMPVSLTDFTVWNVGLTALPRFSVPSSTQLSQTSPLRAVRIIQCPRLITLYGFLQQDTVNLHGLEFFNIDCCENLAEISMHAFRTCVSLKELEIKDCPKLVRLPCLPFSLIKFSIIGIGVNALPEYFECSSGSSGGSSRPSSFVSSLRDVHISRCPNLIALNGFLQQDNIDFRFFDSFWLTNCKNLVQIQKDLLPKFVSLDILFIGDCPKLVAVDNQNNLLPRKLSQIYMGNCGEFDVPLLESSSGLTTLNVLGISYSKSITRIPSRENVFGSLSKLEIRGCTKLIELSQNADQGSEVVSLKIKDLYIDKLSLLLIEPLRSLKYVSVLSVSDCSMMEALPEPWLLQNSSTLRKLSIADASTLRSLLPATMARLPNLESLYIFKADLLVELPELPSLKECKIMSSDGVHKF